VNDRIPSGEPDGNIGNGPTKTSQAPS